MIYGNLMTSMINLEGVTEESLRVDYMEAMLEMTNRSSEILYESYGFELEPIQEANVFSTIFSKIKSLLVAFKNKLVELWNKFIGLFKKKKKEVEDAEKQAKESPKQNTASTNNTSKEADKPKETGANSNSSTTTRSEKSEPVKEEPKKPETIQYREFDKMFEETTIDFSVWKSSEDIAKISEIYITATRKAAEDGGIKASEYFNSYYGKEDSIIPKRYDFGFVSKIIVSGYGDIVEKIKASDNDLNNSREIVKNYPNTVKTITMSYDEAKRLKRPNFDGMISKLKSEYNKLKADTEKTIGEISKYQNQLSEYAETRKDMSDKYERKHAAEFDKLDHKRLEDMSEDEKRKMRDKRSLRTAYHRSEDYASTYINDLRSLSLKLNHYSNYCLLVLNTMQGIAGRAMSEYIRVQRQL